VLFRSFSSTSLCLRRQTGDAWRTAHPTSLRTIEIRKLEVRECKHALSSAFQAEKLDIVKEDLCGHVMLHVEGRVPLVWPGLLGLTWERRLCVVCHGFWEVLPVLR